MIRKHNESIEIIEKLALLCFESSGKVHERHNSALYIGHAYQPHPLMFSAHAHNRAEYVGKGHQQAHVNHCSTTALISVDALQDADA